MQSTYIATCTAEDGTTVCRIVRVIGRAPVDTIRQTLEKHGVQPREIARAPDKATLEQITDGLTIPYRVVYLMGK